MRVVQAEEMQEEEWVRVGVTEVQVEDEEAKMRVGSTGSPVLCIPLGLTYIPSGLTHVWL